MIASERVLKGSTTRITSLFVNDSGEGLVGLSPTIRVYDRGANQYLKNDGTWVSGAPVGSENVMIETDGVDLPGVYHFDFALRGTLTSYHLRSDGGSASANRFQDGEIVAVSSDEAELHTAFAMVANERVHTVSTGVDVILDNDGTTTLRTMTPTDNGNDSIRVVPS